MAIDRRSLISLLGVSAGVGASASSPADAIALPRPGKHAPAFRHGVASGDPDQTSILLWTRLSDLQSAGALTGREFAGVCELSASPDFSREVVRKPFSTNGQRDFTVKVVVDSLTPGTDYWYRFSCRGVVSPVGRTRTLPDGPTRDVVLAVATCSLYPNGYFNAYGAIGGLARVDAVLHLGDYIYEYGGPGSYGMDSAVAAERPHDPPHECLTLADYRRRHAQYRADPQLQAAHARAPWIVVWDDHESANDSWQGGAENHNPDKGEGDWATRKAAALKAYFEWMPIRDPAPGRMADAIYRSFRFGDLASLMMTETRLVARSKQLRFDADLPMVDGKPDVAAFNRLRKDPARHMMGPAQEEWIGRELDRSVKAGETWQVIGNQLVMARVAAPNLPAVMGNAAWSTYSATLSEGERKRVERLAMLSGYDIPSNLDAWDGYPAARERLYDRFKAAGAHPIVLSGDSHSFWANELWDEAGHMRVAAEFGSTGITSPGFADVVKGAPIGEALVARNPEVRYADSLPKGFVLLTLTRTAATAEMVAVSTIVAKDFSVARVKAFSITPVPGGGVSALTEV